MIIKDWGSSDDYKRLVDYKSSDDYKDWGSSDDYRLGK